MIQSQIKLQGYLAAAASWFGALGSVLSPLAANSSLLLATEMERRYPMMEF